MNSLVEIDESIVFTKVSDVNTDFVIDGIHFGRGDSYVDKNASIHLQHITKGIKCWKIVENRLENIADETKNSFCSKYAYIVQWNSNTNTIDSTTQKLINTFDNQIYFYWKGENADKGYSPLPEVIEVENPPVERIVQWAEPPAFLQLFLGTFVVHLDYNKHYIKNHHLYILRGEMENELHLYEVPLKRENLRSRTSFVLYFPEKKSYIIWHGSRTNDHAKKRIKKIAQDVFGDNFTETLEELESETFISILPYTAKISVTSSHSMDYTPKLFYFNNITGNFLATEIKSTHKSSHITPLPFLQSHLYSAVQPATFLLDDHEIIWLWQGWHYDDQDENFKSECFVAAIEYARQKSKILEKLVKVQKVSAGFEPDDFINSFPTWTIRQDVVNLKIKKGIESNPNQLVENIDQEISFS